MTLLEVGGFSGECVGGERWAEIRSMVGWLHSYHVSQDKDQTILRLSLLILLHLLGRPSVTR